MKPVKLITTQSQFEGLHESLDKTRRSSQFVKVNRQAFNNLLLDHTELLGRVEYVNAEE